MIFLMEKRIMPRMMVLERKARVKLVVDLHVASIACNSKLVVGYYQVNVASGYVAVVVDLLLISQLTVYEY